MSGVMIVTGGSRGIGAAISRRAARAGFDVCVNYARAKDRAEEVVHDVIQAGQRAIAVQADVGTEEGVIELFRRTDAELGPVTALVNNAAIDYETAVVDAELKRVRGVFNLNIFGVIVNVGSISSRYGGLPGDVVYASSKGALDSFTLGLSREIGPEGIRVCCVRPGITRTEIFEASIGIERAEAIAKAQTVLGRICEPEEVANLVVWICTDEASYVTTTIYDISGGR